MGIAHSDLSTRNKLLLLLKTNSRRDKPLLVDAQKLSKQWGIPHQKISHDLSALRDDKKIALCDDQGTIIKHPKDKFTVGQALVQIVMDEAGYLPWDKPTRRIYARIIGAKMACLRLIIQRTGVLDVERNQHGWPIGLRINDWTAAQAYIGEGKVALKTQHYGSHYYRYLKGYSPPKEKEAPLPKPKPYTNAHRLLERVIENGGDWWVRPIDVCRELGFYRSGLYRQVRKLDGIISYQNGRIKLINPEKAALFLSEVTGHPTTTTAVSHSSPLTHSSVVLTESTTASTTVDAFVASSNPRKQRLCKASTIVVLGQLVIRRRLELEIAQRLVWYPRAYRLLGKGREIMAKKYVDVAAHDEMVDEERRRQLGAMWGRQKAIVLRILNALSQTFPEWSAMINDELVTVTAQKLRGALPSVESPDHKVAEQVADWLENDLEGDDDAQTWIKEFGLCAGVEFLSEFVCRGGTNLLMYLMYTNTTESEAQYQGYSWYVHLILAYANQHRFNPKYPESFNANIFDAVDAANKETSFMSGDVVTEALTRYLECGGRLSIIRHRAPWITRKLNEAYPRTTNDGEMIWHRAWNNICTEDGRLLIDTFHEYWEDFCLLCDWMDEYTPDHDEAERHQPEKFTLSWYQSMLKSAQDYGMPGDLEALNDKIRLIKEWPKATMEKQKGQLVPGLNTPGRYDNPRLNWQQWDELIRWELK